MSTTQAAEDEVVGGAGSGTGTSLASVVDEGANSAAADSAAGKAPRTPDDVAADVARQLDKRLGAIDHSLAGAVRLVEARDATVTRLHDEVQRLRAGELHQATMPLLRDLIQLHDALALAAVGGVDVARNELESFRSMVVDILYRHDVEAYGAALGEAVDAKRHRIIAGVDTADPALDRTIAAVARHGFMREDRVVRLADVKAYRFRAPA